MSDEPKKERKQRSDKGAKRERYKMNLREARKVSNDMLRTIADIAERERRLVEKDIAEPKDKPGEKQKRKPYKRKKPQSRTIPLQEWRRNKRLEVLPENRICPICKVLKLESKKWVDDEVFGVICKSCWSFYTSAKCWQELANHIGESVEYVIVMWRKYCSDNKVRFREVCVRMGGDKDCYCRQCNLNKFAAIMCNKMFSK